MLGVNHNVFLQLASSLAYYQRILGDSPYMQGSWQQTTENDSIILGRKGIYSHLYQIAHRIQGKAGKPGLG